MLAENGVNRILLSADAFHQETIPVEPVMFFAECVRKEGISVRMNPAWLVSKEDDNKEYVNPYEEDPRDIHAISFDPNGDVLNGNINRDNIMDILDSYTVSE